MRIGKEVVRIPELDLSVNVESQQSSGLSPNSLPTMAGRFTHAPKVVIRAATSLSGVMTPHSICISSHPFYALIN